MFFYLECHEGDDNDNSIADYVIECQDEETLFAYLRCNQLEVCGEGSDVDWSGDNAVSCMFSSKTDGCPSGSDCEEEHCGYDHRLYHRDFYLRSTHETEDGADAERCRWHRQTELIRLDSQGREI